MEQKKWKFNVIDALAVFFIILGVCLVGWKLMNRGGSSGQVEMMKVTYEVTVEGVRSELYERCQAHLPSLLMASGELVGGQIESVRKQPYYELSGDGEWVEDPEHCTLIFTATTETPKTAVMTTKVGEQEVRIGKRDYILKSEYIEFAGGIITDVKWGE